MTYQSIEEDPFIPKADFATAKRSFTHPVIPPYPSFQALIHGLRAGEEDALVGVLTAYGKQALSFASRIAGIDQADAIVNTSLYNLYRVFTSDNPPDEGLLLKKGLFAYWLSTVHHASVDELRKSYRHKLNLPLDEVNPDVLDYAYRDDHGPLEGLEQDERAREIRTAVQQLPKAQRDAIVANFYGELTHLEIAEVFKEPPGTIKARIKLGYQKLRPHLAHLR